MTTFFLLSDHVLRGGVGVADFASSFLPPLLRASDSESVTSVVCRALSVSAAAGASGTPVRSSFVSWTRVFRPGATALSRSHIFL